MERMTLANTIKSITKDHLENGDGILFGQCITAVGWVNGSVPDCKNIVELPMTDVAGAGFAVGAAIAGRRPIFVLRFQDFFTLNCNQIVHYAAISKELHEQGIPIFVRCIGTDAAGPVHSVMLHNIPMYFPGIKVYAPMTANEYRETWEDFMNDDIPMFVSEHRSAYQNTEEMCDHVMENSDIVLFGISDARTNMMEAAAILQNQGIKVSTVHIMKLKPLNLEYYIDIVRQSGAGFVIDNGFPTCGASRDIAYQLMEGTDRRIYALSSEDRVKCFNPQQQNRTPNAERIVQQVHMILNRF